MLDEPIALPAATHACSQASEAAPAPRLQSVITPRDWPHVLADMDACLPIEGYDPERWKQVLEDARWFAGKHGMAASALGWTASDLFGFDGRDGWGGVVDRLEGARRIILSDTVARWKNDDCEGWLWRASLPQRAPIWAYGKGGAHHG